MPTAKELKKFQEALAKAQGIFEGIDFEQIRIPVESPQDLIREAASVIAYFDLKEQFKEETCRGCGELFAYAYYATSVKHCSIPCLKRQIEAMGLLWDPSRPYEDRWRSRYVPAIVPAAAYALIKQQAPEPEGIPEPAVVNNAIGAADLMAKLAQMSQP